MTVLVDTNVLLRLAHPTDPLRVVARVAVTALRAGGGDLRTLPQNLYEFWVVATRPVDANGLGLSAARGAVEMAKLSATFPPLGDPPDLLDRWRTLVTSLGVVGKAAHDGRLVAGMVAHGVARILTFNGPDFARYPGLTVLDPHAVAAAPSVVP